ncbi:MAG: sortase B protein-sorting domain-containing protein, partial [Agathobacter sp.]
LCLNGHNITGDIDNLIKVNQNAIFTLTDCGSGKIITGDHTTVRVNSGGTFNMYGGSFSGQTRGTQFIVWVDGTFNMYGGNISENTFIYGQSESGSPVKVCNNSVFNMYGGSISQNKGSHCGAGVQNYGGFNMSGGTISGNETTNSLVTDERANGGGVYNNGTFAMSGGKISGNKAYRDGGGVYNDSNSTINMTGGDIKDNSAGRNGGGVYDNGTLSLSGVVTILNNKVGSNDNNLFLPADKKITMNANVLTGGTGSTGETHIGVTTATLPADGSSVIIADITGDVGSAACGNRFFSDNQDYRTFVHITADATTVELEKKPNSGGTNPPAGNTNPSDGEGNNQDAGSNNAGMPSSSSPTYQIINGANSTWTAGGSEALTIRGNGEFSKFTGVKVDGKLIDRSNYTAQEGSTIIALNASYLSTLAAGTHTIEIVWTDNSASTTFTINANTSDNGSNSNTPSDGSALSSGIDKKDDVPKTGDSSPIVWLFVLAGLSGTGLLLIRKKDNKSLKIVRK